MLELNFEPFPDLETHRLLLRRISPADVEEMFVLRSSRQVMRYLDRPLAATRQDAAELIERIEKSLADREGLAWGITAKPSPAMIGTISFWRILKEHDRAEIGYMLHPDFQGRGVMFEAMGAAIEYGFRTMKLHSIEANVNPANLPSIRLLERHGFVREAYFRENYFWEGRYLDSAIYCRLVTDEVRSPSE
jgi:ribosomal-protein-alanine N-acetyltransferase